MHILKARFVQIGKEGGPVGQEFKNFLTGSCECVRSKSISNCVLKPAILETRDR